MHHPSILANQAHQLCLRLSAILFVCLPAGLCLAQSGAASDEQVLDLATVTEQPEFVGGMDAMYAWMGAHQHYPDSAYIHKREGKVYVQFTVGKTGAIEDARVLRGADPYLDAEALRLVTTMPPWNPGRLEGKVVRCRFNLPIVFKLGTNSK